MSIESKVRYALYVLLVSFLTLMINVFAYLTVPQKVLTAAITYSSRSIAIELLMLIFVFGPMCFYAADKIMGKPLVSITIGDDKEKS